MYKQKVSINLCLPATDQCSGQANLIDTETEHVSLKSFRLFFGIFLVWSSSLITITPTDLFVFSATIAISMTSGYKCCVFWSLMLFFHYGTV